MVLSDLAAKVSVAVKGAVVQPPINKPTAEEVRAAVASVLDASGMATLQAALSTDLTAHFTPKGGRP